MQQQDSACEQQPVPIARLVRFTGTPKVELVDWMEKGGDLAVVRNGRQTVGKKPITEMPLWGPAFIDRMIEHRHGTPFEAAVFTFSVDACIAVTREWMRHRIGSFNELSLRVAEATPTFHLPNVAQARTDVGRYQYGKLGQAAYIQGQGLMEGTFESCWATYRELIELGWARDLARLVLPVGLYTRFNWTVNARSLMNFLNLRTAPDAWPEIRDAAELVADHFSVAMPITAAAFEKHGRKAP